MNDDNQQRRAELVEKKRKSLLSIPEKEELDRLQMEFGQYQDRIAPLPSAITDAPPYSTGVEGDTGRKHTPPVIAESTGLANKQYITHYGIETDACIRLLEILGLTEAHKTQRVVIDINEFEVHVYTKAVVHELNQLKELFAFFDPTPKENSDGDC